MISGIWTLVREDCIVGAIAIDGEDMGPGVTHLRWFITDDPVRGLGMDRQLLAQALRFVDGQRFAQAQLWSFQGLTAAHHLYTSHDFQLA